MSIIVVGIIAVAVVVAVAVWFHRGLQDLDSAANSSDGEWWR